MSPGAESFAGSLSPICLRATLNPNCSLWMEKKHKIVATLLAHILHVVCPITVQSWLP